MPALKSGFLPPARRASTLVLCKRQGFLFGGWREEGYSNELFVVTMSRDVNNSIAFSPAITTGVPPIPRAGHACCLVGEGTAANTIAVFGGASGGPEGNLNDLFLLDCETLEWTEAPVTAGQRPSGRSRLAMEHSNGSIFILGGANEQQDFGGEEVWAYRVAQKKWDRLQTSGTAPCPRWGLTASLVRGKIYVFGGQMSLRAPPSERTADDLASLSFMYALDVQTLTWEIVRTFGTGPCPRAGHTCNVFGDRYLVIFGGGDGMQMFNDLFLFDCVCGEWIPLVLPSAAAPSLVTPRWAHVALPFDGQLLVYGGANGPVAYQEVLSVAVDLLAARAMGEKLGGLYDLVPLFLGPEDTTSSAEKIVPPTQQRGKMDPLQAWLRSLGVEEYAPLFLAENISLRHAPFLTEDHLEELGVDSLSGRLTIMAGVHQLKMLQAQQLSSFPVDSNATNMVLLANAVAELSKTVEQLKK